ncbi:MAG: LLM class flavin-dependent oxidoreductase, partial [Actinobacteria bacterium]|nr:LLM class flavin-dependent oxidoreductase [Actinomycetota bacterium]
MRVGVEVGRIGVWVPSGLLPTDPGEARTALDGLAELGYQALWLGRSPAGTLEQPEGVLAATSKLTVATGIVSIWPHPPATVAAAYHRVTAAYPGRFLLGLGVSHAHLVEPSGQEYARPYRKVVEFL